MNSINEQLQDIERLNNSEQNAAVQMLVDVIRAQQEQIDSLRQSIEDATPRYECGMVIHE